MLFNNFHELDHAVDFVTYTPSEWETSLNGVTDLTKGNNSLHHLVSKRRKITNKYTSRADHINSSSPMMSYLC